MTHAFILLNALTQFTLKLELGVKCSWNVYLLSHVAQYCLIIACCAVLILILYQSGRQCYNLCCFLTFFTIHVGRCYHKCISPLQLIWSPTHFRMLVGKLG